MDRFIPTPVGNTLFRHPGKDYAAVHPHACGEHDIFVLGEQSLLGSSPRLWGTRGFGCRIWDQ